MIILISGTSGSGKTVLVKRVLEKLPLYDYQISIPTQKKSLGYIWEEPPLAVMGRYDATCGGCDTLSWKGGADDIERVLNDQVLGYDRHVILEGLLVATWGIPRLTRLSKLGLTVIHLTTSVEECVASVQKRRTERAAAKGKEPTPFNPDNTVGKHHGLLSVLSARRAAGITVETLDREAAYARTVELLGLKL